MQQEHVVQQEHVDQQDPVDQQDAMELTEDVDQLVRTKLSNYKTESCIL